MRRIRIPMRRTGVAANAATPGRASLVRIVVRQGCRLLLLLALIGTMGTHANAQSDNQAALVVVHGDGQILTRCINFAETQISGMDLLQRAGLDLNLEASSMGATICRLDGEGCTFPQQSCFCQCEGGESCTYWTYWQRQNEGWRYSQLGASNSTVLPGGMNAWLWGDGTADSARQPPALTFAEVCAPPPATSTMTPTPAFTPTALSTPAATEVPTGPPTGPPTFTPIAPTPLPVTAVAAVATPLPTATPWPTSTLLPTLTSTPAPTAVQPPAPVIDFLVADRREITAGETVTLAWRVRNATGAQLQADGRTVVVAPEGNLLLAPPQNTTYQLIAVGDGGSASTGMTIIVRPRMASSMTLAGSAAAEPTLPLAESRSSSLVTPPVSQPVASPSPPPLQVVVVTPQQLMTASFAPTLAPVVLAASVETPNAAIASSPASLPVSLEVGATAPLFLIGALVLGGVPLFGISFLLLFWILRRLSG